MDYLKFIEELPNLYENWGQKLVTPKSNRFERVLEQARGTTQANVLQLLNFAVDCMEPNEIYCEVGCFQGATLIGALLDRPERMAYAINSFPYLDTTGLKFDKLTEILSNFNLTNQVCLCDENLEEFFLNLRQMEPTEKIGLYFYDGVRDYRSHLIGMLLVRPFLARQALIISTNSNVDIVHQANWDFVEANPECELLLNLAALKDEYYIKWNGLQVFGWDADKKNNYNWLDFQEVRRPEVIQSIYTLKTDEQKKVIVTLHNEALGKQHSRQYPVAEQKYREVLQWDSNQADAWHNLGLIYYSTERYQEALELLLKSLEIDSSKAMGHYSVGLVLEKIGDISQAILAYQESIALDPNWVEAYNNLGNILYQAGFLEQAEAIYRASIATNPNHFGSYLNLGNILMAQMNINEAIEAYEKALHLKHRDPDILYNLGVAFDAKNDPAQAALYYGYASYRRGQYHQAISQFQRFLETQIGDGDFYIALASCYQELHQYESAIKTYKTAIEIYPQDAEIYFVLVTTLQDLGFTQEAIAIATEGSQLLPDSLVLRLEKQHILPILYENEEEITFYRNRFIQGLEELIQQTYLDTPEARKNALIGVSRRTNFYLQYQCYNDLELQKQYGQFVHQIMAANYPQWVAPLPMPPVIESGKLRIGYVSHYFKDHTVAKLLLGWLKYHNKNDLEIYCYYTGDNTDYINQQFRLYSDAFHHIPNDLEAVCKQIVSDKLHILVFTDIGMHPQYTQMAGLRLASVQCTTWAHPITSGSPTIDYYLSSDLMEPDNSQEHYSEQLVCLPNLGFSYIKPDVPQPTKNRIDFGLRDDAVVYLSCQSLFKYLPQYDYIFAEIARYVPHAQFAFLSFHRSVHITNKFQQRLKRAFAKLSLDSDDYCVFLPRQHWVEYLNLNLVSDIFLDTFGWSGGNTTLEAIACNLPVVTCPGAFMRGRHSYAILKMLGCEETIALNEDKYIEIAVKLGLDREWRNSIVALLKSRHQHLYDDKVCVAGLEAFYRHVVQERQPAPTVAG